MSDSEAFLEEMWGALLSRESTTVLCAYHTLDPQSRRVVLDHLNKMSTEPGWHAEQALSAKYALDAIQSEEIR